MRPDLARMKEEGCPTLRHSFYFRSASQGYKTFFLVADEEAKYANVFDPGKPSSVSSL